MKALPSPLRFSAISLASATLLWFQPPLAATEPVILQGPDITEDAAVRGNSSSGAGDLDVTNNSTSASYGISEREAYQTGAVLIRFDLKAYKGATIKDASLQMYFYQQQNMGSPSAIAVQEIGIRPLKHTWEMTEVTMRSRNLEAEWEGGTLRADYSSSTPSDVAETVNFGPRLATMSVNAEETGIWISWSDPELDRHLNSVLSGKAENHGFIVEAGMHQWGNHTRYLFHSSRFDKDPTLQPKLVFTVVSKPEKE